MIKVITIITKFIVVALMALLFSSCNHAFIIRDGIKGSGNKTTETRTVNEDFKKIEVNTGIKVIVEQSNSKSITVETDSDLQKHIVTKVENGVLIIECDKSYDIEQAPVVHVKMPVINGLSSNSGSEIISSKTLITDKIEVKSNSGSKININVEADEISLESASGSNIEASGKALKLETESSSGSEIEADKLMTNEVIAQSSSGSSTSVYPIVKLEAKASSGSSIRYSKNPKTISKEESSGGSVEQK